VSLAYLPRPDGTALTDSPDILVQSGRYAKVPFINGNQEDEGTIFALFQPNISTTAQLSTYFKELFFHNAPKSTIDQLIGTYQTISEDGSPFRTLLLNNWYPQYKRLAAILGDLTFILTRRIFLETASAVNPGVKSWSYLASYNYGTPILGTFHGSDLIQVFYGIVPNVASASIRGYYYSFVHHLDPNEGNRLPNWPQWSASTQLMQFFNNRLGLLKDDFRSDSAEFLKKNIASFKI
jgi:carboxylesterase type B